MIFQDSLGISITGDSLSIAHLRGKFRGVQLVRQGVYPLDPESGADSKNELIRSMIEEFRREHHIAKADVFLGIPSELAMCREIILPLAVKENLRATLRYEMEKYVPLPADDIYFDYQLIEEKKAESQLRLLLVVVKKKDLEPCLSLCRLLSADVSGISINSAASANALALEDKKTAADSTLLEIIHKKRDIEPDKLKKTGLSDKKILPAFGLGLRSLEDLPFQLNLLPPEMRRRPSRLGYYVLAAALFLAILAGAMWGGGYIMRQRMTAQELDAEIQRLASEVVEIDRMRSQIQETEERMNRLNRLTRGDVPMMDVIRELTQLIPENAWVQDFNLNKNKARISGFAESASELIPLLESSLLFKDVVFLSTITKNKEGKERFSIGFELKSLFDEEEAEKTE